MIAVMGIGLAVGFHTSFAAAGVERQIVGTRGVVVSGSSAATDAGVRILEQGGNAADAGAATLLALSVTTVGSFCIG